MSLPQVKFRFFHIFFFIFFQITGMAYWPEDHGFYFAKLNVEHVILLAGFGGANEVPVEDYFAAILD